MGKLEEIRELLDQTDRTLGELRQRTLDGIDIEQRYRIFKGSESPEKRDADGRPALASKWYFESRQHTGESLQSIAFETRHDALRAAVEKALTERRGRKRRSDDGSLTRPRAIRFSDSEWTKLGEIAAGGGMSVADLIRNRILGDANEE